MTRHRGRLLLIGGLAAVAGLHAAPGVSGIAPVRRRLFPRLHGIGAPDRVALTFDDGPDAESTPLFLDALGRLGWKATFFMLGSMATRHPGVAAEVAAAGHEVALHGETHRSHLARPPWAVHDDVCRGFDHVARATGAAPAYFRPPYGALSSGSLATARALGLETVLWTTWGRDWRAAATPASVRADVASHLLPGATVLLHDSDCTSAPGCWRAALGALPLLGEELAARGLRVVPLREHSLPGAPAGEG